MPRGSPDFILRQVFLALPESGGYTPQGHITVLPGTFTTLHERNRAPHRSLNTDLVLGGHVVDAIVQER